MDKHKHIGGFKLNRPNEMPKKQSDDITKEMIGDELINKTFLDPNDYKKLSKLVNRILVTRSKNNSIIYKEEQCDDATNIEAIMEIVKDGVIKPKDPTKFLYFKQKTYLCDDKMSQTHNAIKKQYIVYVQDYVRVINKYRKFKNITPLITTTSYNNFTTLVATNVEKYPTNYNINNVLKNIGNIEPSLITQEHLLLEITFIKNIKEILAFIYALSKQYNNFVRSHSPGRELGKYKMNMDLKYLSMKKLVYHHQKKLHL